MGAEEKFRRTVRDDEGTRDAMMLECVRRNVGMQEKSASSEISRSAS